MRSNYFQYRALLSNFPKFLRFFVRQFAKIARVFVVWRAPIFSSKWKGKFFCFETEISSKFQGGSGAEAI